ncbi:UvrD-helicase domain-containing protein [Saccharopolyspora erythraea]|uniref:UvrD-helicase domain-containing protein n=1 Tax=Saccharopolyspora erythraea TaxID=1836 RepID=UPI001BEE76D5|nr:UvrD-helicase domain-containing protein [Saccharopolyspora erythraea]QUH02905.1 UvrD-helicase domain-containing protein [Saccharopolyspora erythraea]
MRYYADLHIHSKYSRACSKDCDIEHLTWWARRKGISLVGTGDFTHPAWFAHLREVLEPAEPGVFRLRPEHDREFSRTMPPTCSGDVRFMLSVEISTIYKYGDFTRKVHHLCYMPDFAAAEKFNQRLGRIGNLGSDGRPILGLDSRDLLEITLESGDGAYLVPAHIWTPWFAVLGSKAGFNSIEECYRDLSEYIFALETGLSSDPEMNWRVSMLDRYTLVSHSDAHSPPMLGREASVFDTDLDYFAVRDALRTGAGYEGTVEFFPEEGKYHLDGHRKCDVRMEPGDTRAHGGRCPSCGKPLTVGVLHRVDALADRPAGVRPDGAAGYRNLIPLPEIVGEILGVGPKSKKVRSEIDRLTAAHGPELSILEQVPLDELRRSSEPLAEAVDRLRRGQVIRESGYDGEYGVIRLFEPGELHRLRSGHASALFDDALFTPARPAPTRPATVEPNPPEPADEPQTPAARPDAADGVLAGLDPDQRAAASVESGPLLIVAGPGTGKTRTVTHRIAHLVLERQVPARECLAITFTRRAAEEMTERLHALAGPTAAELTVATFHSFGLQLLRDHHDKAGLSADFGLADASVQHEVLTEVAGDERAARALRSELSRARRGGDTDEDTASALHRYTTALRERNLIDFDDLIVLPVRLLESDGDLRAAYRDRFRWITVDEYQDVDEMQYRLLRQLAPAAANLTAIGDPDQAIYSFRGADVGFFLRFQKDWPQAPVVQLTRNYRSGRHILDGAVRAIRPSTLVPDRVLLPAGDRPAQRITVHEAADEHAEAAFVARSIDRLLGGASFHSLDSGRVDGDGPGGIGFADIAVLYRTDSQSRAVLDELVRCGLPVQKRSHDPLSARPGVDHLMRELALMPAREGSVPERVRWAAEAVLTAMPDAGQEQTAEIHAAAELLTPLAQRCGDDVQRFRRELMLGAEVDALDPRADAISLLTLHAAKGLEFPVVFVVGCEDGLLPLHWPGSTPGDDDIAEERRLFFVGMTRAQDHLYLTRAARRTRHGTERDSRPSPFLAGLGEDIVERIAAPARRRTRATQLSLL